MLSRNRKRFVVTLKPLAVSRCGTLCVIHFYISTVNNSLILLHKVNSGYGPDAKASYCIPRQRAIFAGGVPMYPDSLQCSELYRKLHRDDKEKLSNLPRPRQDDPKTDDLVLRSRKRLDSCKFSIISSAVCLCLRINM